MQLRRCLIFFILLTTFSLSAQTGWIGYKFNHLNTKNGLSNSEITCVIQDSIGYIWIGTKDGLNRYDGYNFKVYKYSSNTTGTLSDNIISAMHVDKKGRLWIGTQQGISLYNYRGETFDNFLLDTESPALFTNNKVNTFINDNNGDIYVSSEGGWIYRFNENLKKFEHTNQINFGLIKDMVIDNFNNIYIASNNGLYKYSINSNKVKARFTLTDPIYKIPSIKLTALCLVGGELWVGTEDKNIFILDIFTNKITELPLQNEGQRFVLRISKDKQNNVWVGDFSGLRFYPVNSKTSINYYHMPEDELSLGGGGILYMYPDKQNNIWLAIGHIGVDFIINNKKFEHFRKEPLSTIGLVDNLTSSILADSKGNIWFGSFNGGITIINRKINSNIKIKNSNNYGLDMSTVFSIYEDSKGTILVTTFSGGVYYWDEISWRFKKFEDKYGNCFTLPGKDVRSIVEDKRGNYWVLVHGKGIVKFDMKAKTSKLFAHDYTNPNHSLLDDWSLKLFCASNGKLWVGGPSGVSLIDPETNHINVYQYNPNNLGSVTRGVVNSISEDRRGYIWLTTDYGFCRYNAEDNNFVDYSKKAGIENNKFCAIIDDSQGFLWISSNKGIYKYNLTNNKLLLFTEGDGLQSNEFLPGSCSLSNDGFMYFGGREGVTGFFPGNIVDQTDAPNVQIIDVKLFNESILNPYKDTTELVKLRNSFRIDRHLKLKYNQDVITLEFVAFNFINPQKNQYAYKLEGFDENWNYVVGKRDVTYTNLDPGTYKFLVKASNPDGYWNETGDYVIITIIPPIWEKNWFRILVASIIIIIIYVFIYIREKRIEYSKLLLEQTVKDRTSELRAAHKQIINQRDELTLHRDHLEEIVQLRTTELKSAKIRAEESDKLKSSFLANMSHEIRTPMNAITGFIHLLKEVEFDEDAKQKYISIITRNSEILLRLIDDILDFSKIEAGELKISLQPFSLNTIVDEINTSYVNILMERNASSMRNVRFQSRNLLSKTLKTQNPNLIIESDKLRLTQVLTNLIENAIKFTEKGYIEIGIEESLYSEDTGEFVSLYVEDTGIGISEEEQPFIFDRFRKVESDISKIYRGVGLGLAISKKLSNLLGGDLSITSKPGVGSRFTLRIPYSYNVDVKIESPKTIIEKFYKNTQLHNSEISILIAEDDDSNYKLLETLLLRESYKIKWAKDGEEAVVMALNLNVDIVLMDIKLPLKNGILAMKEIKQVKPKLPIIAQTAYAMANEKTEMFSAGFDGYLPKPIELKQLKETISKLLLS